MVITVDIDHDLLMINNIETLCWQCCHGGSYLRPERLIISDNTGQGPLDILQLKQQLVEGQSLLVVESDLGHVLEQQEVMEEMRK